MGRSFVGVRVGAGLAAIALLAGPVAAPAVSAAEPRGEQAWWYTAMKIADAHKETTGKGVTVALIDSPIAPSVPELKGQDVKIGDNFCGGEATGTGAIATHGTTMAALIVGSGRGAGGPGIAGIAPDVTLRTYANKSSIPNARCAISGEQAISGGVRQAVADGARIINMSGGLPPGKYGLLQNSIEEALAAGVVVVASAGQQPEDAQVIFPASMPGVVAVSAVDRNANAWDGNVAGNRAAVVISAPGVDMPISGFNGAKWDSSGIADGTSESAALVSGGLALVAAKYPKATGNQLIQHLIHNPGGEDRKFGRNDDFGYGIISVTKMLASDPAQWPDVNPLRSGAASSAGSAGTSPPAGGATTVDGSPVSASSDSDGGGAPVALFVVIAAAVLAGGAFFGLRMRGKGGAPG